MSTVIDLSRLPAPSVVEVVDFETIYAERKAALIALYPEDTQAEIAAALELESEPMAVHLQENAYREVALRQRINESARAVMLAFATGSDLDHLAALLGVERLIITPAEAGSDIAAVMESDTDLRKRVLLAPDSFSVAGPAAAYEATALSADGRVRDAFASSPAPGNVLLTILSRDGDGTAGEALIAAVEAAANAETTRPLTDNVTVQSAEILGFEVEAVIYTFPGPDAAVVVAEAANRLSAYLEDCHKINGAVPISGIHAALHANGIQRVELAAPLADILANETQAPYCTRRSVIYGGING